MGKLPAAAADEEAELRALSDRADQSRQAVAAAADALTGAIAASARPGVFARRTAARAVSPAGQAAGPLRRVATIAVPVLVLTAATVYLLWQRQR
jgi:hypothetical protein